MDVQHTQKNQGPLKKLEDRSKKFVFVGYAPNGYGLWDTERRKIIISRDVRFENDIKQEMKATEDVVNIKINQTEIDSESSPDEMETEEGGEVDSQEMDVEDSVEEYADAEEEEDEEDVLQLRRSTRMKNHPIDMVITCT